MEKEELKLEELEEEGRVARINLFEQTLDCPFLLAKQEKGE